MNIIILIACIAGIITGIIAYAFFVEMANESYLTTGKVIGKTIIHRDEYCIIEYESNDGKITRDRDTAQSGCLYLIDETVSIKVTPIGILIMGQQ